MLGCWEDCDFFEQIIFDNIIWLFLGKKYTVKYT